MSKAHSIELISAGDHGLALRCSNVELADELEDYLVEELGLHFLVKFEEASVLFFFGRDVTVNDLNRAVGVFEARQTKAD